MSRGVGVLVRPPTPLLTNSPHQSPTVSRHVKQKLKLIPRTLKLGEGHNFAIHVSGSALAYRLDPKNGDDRLYLPTIAVRTSEDNYESFRLFHKVEFVGGSLEEFFDLPIPGTNNRAVDYLICKGSLIAYSTTKLPEPPVIESSDRRPSQETFADVLRKYLSPVSESKS